MGPRWGSRAAAREAWVNVNAFLAHLVRSQSDDPITVLAIWPGDFGLWTITDGLEEPNGVNDHGIAAMNWLLVLGDIIHADPKWGGKPGRQTEGPVREGALWQAEQAKGASQYGRWAFWKRRVNGIAEDDAFDPAVRDTAKRTHHHMERFR